MANAELTVALREGTGKGAARAARREGLVPGVIYGGDETPVAINVKFSELFKMLKAGGFLSQLLDLKIDGKTQKAVCRGVQRDVVKDLPTHVDFMRLTEKTRLSMNIPVVFENEETCPGIKAGGVLTVVRGEVEMRVTAGNIPEALVVDLEAFDVGDTINISNIALPDGTRTVIQGRDFVIANISAPSSLRSADDEDGDDVTEGEGDAGAEDAPAEE